MIQSIRAIGDNATHIDYINYYDSASALVTAASALNKAKIILQASFGTKWKKGNCINVIYSNKKYVFPGIAAEKKVYVLHIIIFFHSMPKHVYEWITQKVWRYSSLQSHCARTAKLMWRNDGRTAFSLRGYRLFSFGRFGSLSYIYGGSWRLDVFFMRIYYEIWVLVLLRRYALPQSKRAQSAYLDRIRHKCDPYDGIAEDRHEKISVRAIRNDNLKELRLNWYPAMRPNSLQGTVDKLSDCEVRKLKSSYR